MKSPKNSSALSPSPQSTIALPSGLFPFLWYFLRRHKVLVAFYVALPLLAGFGGPFNSRIIKWILDLLPTLRDRGGDLGRDISLLMLPTSLLVLNFLMLDNVTWRGIGYMRARHIPGILNAMMGTLMGCALGKDTRFYQDTYAGSLSKQITHLVDGLEEILAGIMPHLFRGTSVLLVAVVLAHGVHPLFSVILILWFGVFLGISLFMSSKLEHLSAEKALTESQVMGQLVDALSNASSVRLFSAAPYETGRMGPFFTAQQAAYTANYGYYNLMSMVQGGLIALMMAATGYSLVVLYGKKAIGVGDFALILGLSMELGYIMWHTMDQVNRFHKELGRCKQALKTLMVPAEITDALNACVLDCDGSVDGGGDITFERVSFSYHTHSPLFENLSLYIPFGQKVGLVGYSGGGKSTFVNLILRLYDVTGGKITLGGQGVRSVTQDSLRQHMAVIAQDPQLFHRTLMENIRYGRRDASDEEVVEAAKKAHAHAFIEALPLGYHTLVGERGVKLSGGQKQRINLARAILKNAPILILDEATSALDSLSERLIQESLTTVMAHKTTLVIAHRLSTLLHMDRILVFDQGRIIEDGTHHELLAKNGLYKALWDAQVGGFLGDKIQ